MIIWRCNSKILTWLFIVKLSFQLKVLLITINQLTYWIVSLIWSVKFSFQNYVFEKSTFFGSRVPMIFYRAFNLLQFRKIIFENKQKHTLDLREFTTFMKVYTSSCRDTYRHPTGFQLVRQHAAYKVRIYAANSYLSMKCFFTLTILCIHN